jgi:hypothetical protein
MLDDENIAIDAYDFSVWKCLLKLSKSHFVFFGLIVGGNKNGSVDDKEISMCCR